MDSHLDTTYTEKENEEFLASLRLALLAHYGMDFSIQQIRDSFLIAQLGLNLRGLKDIIDRHYRKTYGGNQ